jgi:GDPmannose 4,6-dehydratase
MKRALITGITAQDGSYLAEFLLNKGYEVHGIDLPAGVSSGGYLDMKLIEEKDRLFVHEGDLADGSNFKPLFDKIQPDEVYNLAAQSHVGTSFEQPVLTANVNALGTMRILEAVRNLDKKVKFFQASTGDMFGKGGKVPQNEKTCFHPRNPYACSKVYAHYQTVNYREAYGMFACSGILYNHESPRRGENFVTRKITRAAARIKLGTQKKLLLGNIDARRDWGFAGDYVEAMYLMLQNDEPDDFVIATGEMHSVREFLELSFGRLDLDWEQFVEIDPRYFRPTEAEVLVGDASKARKVLGWEPKVAFDELVVLMVDHDMAEALKE